LGFALAGIDTRQPGAEGEPGIHRPDTRQPGAEGWAVPQMRSSEQSRRRDMRSCRESRRGK
jgi:hypothetical protein